MTIEIVNSYGPGPGRKYCIYSEAPQISVGDVQQSGSLRIASYVVGPIEYGGRKEFSYRARYFGFIGKISEVGGKRIVKSEMERDVKVGAIDNWTGFNASLPDGVLTIQCSSQLDSAQGSFIIRCDPNPAPHDVSVFVGLAQLFDGKLVPVAAVPYVHGTTYTIKPRQMYIVQADMIPGQVIPQNIVTSGQAAPGPQVRVRLTENNDGRFRVAVTGQLQGSGTTQIPAIVVMGISGGGKSEFVQRVTGSTTGTGDGIDSVTRQIAGYNATVGGREVLIVDTPGLDDSAARDADILRHIADELRRLDKTPISGLIYIHDITAERLTQTARRYLQLFQDIVGRNALRNVTLLTTKWDRGPHERSVRKEQQLVNGPWSGLIKNCASVRRIDITQPPEAYQRIVTEVLENVATTLLIQQELAQGLSLNETTVGQTLDKEIQEIVKLHKEELQDLNRQLDAAKGDNDRRFQDLQEAKQELRRDLDEARRSRDVLRTEFENDRERIKRMQETIDNLKLAHQPPSLPPGAYGISVQYRSDALTLIDKEGFLGAYWTDSPGAQKLIIGGSGTSGIVRFQLSNGEQIAVALGVHNYWRWCDIDTAVKPNETNATRLFRYYQAGDPKFGMLWKQASSLKATTRRGKTITVDYIVAIGYELQAVIGCF